MSKYGDLAKMRSTPADDDTPVGTKTPSKTPVEPPTVVVGETNSYVDVVRKAVRWPGKETATLRITAEEQNKLKSIIRYFEGKGYYTDKTLIFRICFDFMCNDFEQKGDASLLAEILDRINTY